MGKLQRDQPSKSQAKWLKENFRQFRNKDIAEKFSIPDKRVTDWLRALGLIKEKRVFVKRKKISKKREKFINEPITRLSSEYSNVTREQHIDRILSIKL